MPRPCTDRRADLSPDTQLIHTCVASTQVPGCHADLSTEKPYSQRKRICSHHMQVRQSHTAQQCAVPGPASTPTIHLCCHSIASDHHQLAVAAAAVCRLQFWSTQDTPCAATVSNAPRWSQSRHSMAQRGKQLLSVLVNTPTQPVLTHACCPSPWCVSFSMRSVLETFCASAGAAVKHCRSASCGP